METKLAYLHLYRVAGFLIRVEGLLPPMANMEPFQVTEAGEEEPLFTLRVTASLPPAATTPVYKTDDGPGFPEIAIGALPEGGYSFLVRPLPGRPVSGELRTSADFTRAQIALTGTDNLFALNNALMLLFTFASAPKGALEMHSSVVMHKGRGYLFQGKSGTGKSTHSGLWLKYIPDTELLNDDNPVLRLMPDGSARVFGSPWSGKTPCYKALDVPAGAAVRIRQAPYNRIRPLKPVEAYASLMASASSFRPFPGLADAWHHTLEGLIQALPCFELECLPDREAAELCHDTVANG